jgi:signal transduction histidine kinase
LVGAIAVLASDWLAGTQGADLPYTVLIVVAIAIVGLALGAEAAVASYGASIGTLLVLVASRSEGFGFTSGDTFRFGTLLLGSPAIIFLVWRAEGARTHEAAALVASRAAEEALEAERTELVATRAELDRALAVAHRDQARLEEMAEAIAEPIIVVDGEGNGTYGNRAALQAFGRSFVERSLDDWGRVTQPRDEGGQPLSREEWPQRAAQSEAVTRRMLLRVPMTGRDVMLSVEGMPMAGGGAALLLRDVGKEEDQRRRLSRFASFVAHELRNPLAVAKARIELAQRDPNLPTRAATHGIRALESVDAAIGILERLELYSRADTGRLEVEQQPFELGPALGSAIERLRTRGTDREVVVDLPDAVSVVGDRPLSEQAITNLLVNADRYSALGAPIEITVSAGGVVELRVADGGPGIADDLAEQLFGERVAAAGGGLGLGLYLVHATMTAMGGSVTLEERRPRAVFVLRWPAAPG